MFVNNIHTKERRDRMTNQTNLNSRQEQIYTFLIREGELKVNDLTEKFGVVEMTIRRDLEKMEKMGIVKRTFGGAIPVDPDIGLAKRENLYMEAKNKIGEKAAQYIKSGDAIFIDAGTTTPNLLKYIPRNWNLVIATNAVNVATSIQGANIETILLGGVLRQSTMSLVGPITEHQLDNLSFDKAFFSSSGLTLENGFSNSNVYEVQIKQKAMKQSKEVTFLVDHSKFDVQFLHKITNFEGVDRIITDKKPGNEYCDLITELGIDLVVCDEE